MKTRAQFLAVVCAMALCASLQSQTDTSSGAATQTGTLTKPQKSEVTKLDGTKYFGFIQVTDDYTIRITSDSGITRLPIAQLGDSDFQKYGFQKDRAKDGRFWYERKEALKSAEANPGAAESSESQSKPIAEIRLAEISAFQPLIAAYEKTLASRETKESPTNRELEKKADDSDVPFKPLFSEPGLGGPLPQPFSLGGSPLSGIQPSVPGGGDLIHSATGAAGLPSPP